MAREIIGEGVQLGDVEPTSEEVKAARVAVVETQFAARLAAGLLYQGQVIDIDDGSRANLSGMSQIAGFVLLGVLPAWPESVQVWFARGGAPVALATPQDGIALALAASAYYSALVHQEVALLADPAADPTSGWPG